MNLTFRPANKEDAKEMRFIAEVDSRIPAEYDATYTFTNASIETRLELYHKLSQDDFFEVVSKGNEVIAFHIVRKTPHSPDKFFGNIITLWVHPHLRGQGLAAQLKANAEAWAKKSELLFLQTNVHKSNRRMLDMNERSGYETAYLTMRKTLSDHKDS